MRPLIPLSLALALAVACASPSPPLPANQPPASAGPSSAPAPDVGPSYRGHSLGAVTGHGPPRLSLPAGLELVSEVRHADGWRLVVAHRGVDLIVLLADAAGVVSDDLAVPGGADHLETVVDCSDAAFLVAIESTACGGERGEAAVVRGWNVADGELVEVTEPAGCACELARMFD